MTEAESEQVRLLREIARWTRLTALPAARARAAEVLDTEPKRRVYAALAEGTRSARSLEETTRANHNDIKAWVRAWEAEGLAELGAVPPKAAFTLQELGIEEPPPPTRRRRGAKAT